MIQLGRQEMQSPNGPFIYERIAFSLTQLTNGRQRYLNLKKSLRNHYRVIEFFQFYGLKPFNGDSSRHPPQVIVSHFSANDPIGPYLIPDNYPIVTALSLKRLNPL